MQGVYDPDTPSFGSSGDGLGIQQMRVHPGVFIKKKNIQQLNRLLGQLWVRGRPAVFHAIHLKVAGWNMRRGMVCAKLRKIM